MQQYTLSEFNLLVKKTLSKSLAPSYWIVAEIGEININRNGHCYLDLIEKDDNVIKSKMRGTIWSYAFNSIHNLFINATGSPLKSGMKVLLNASLEFHEIYSISLNIKDIDPNYTLGEREKKKRETIKQLEDEGIIDLNKSLVLPLVPQRVAVVSSESAAGYGDFMSQFNNNAYGYQADFRLFNATMQGDLAVGTILDALHRIYALEDEFDVVVLIRGGGAKTDLDCFDDYDLCSHLAQFPLPVITGIGHERDETIADIVANVSLKTPTAVAEFLISGMMHFESEMNQLMSNISIAANEMIERQLEAINQTNHQVTLIANQRLQSEANNIDRLKNIIETKPSDIVQREISNIGLMAKLIEANDPKAILRKGFSLTKVNGKYTAKGVKIKVGDEIETKTAEQIIRSTVNSTLKSK